jgi:hypothetical protein
MPSTRLAQYCEVPDIGSVVQMLDLVSKPPTVPPCWSFRDPSRCAVLSLLWGVGHSFGMTSGRSQVQTANAVSLISVIATSSPDPLGFRGTGHPASSREGLLEPSTPRIDRSRRKTVPSRRFPFGNRLPSNPEFPEHTAGRPNPRRTCDT